MPASPLHTADAERPARGDLGASLEGVARRRIWLPHLLYEALPYLYIAGGLLALGSTVYVRHWSWLVPHAFLAACISVHLGLYLRRRRLLHRGRHRPGPDEPFWR
jgi:hypothetical protein